jgi:uncharacterized protein
MGNPLSASPEVPLKTQAPRKGGKFKVSQQPLLETERPLPTVEPRSDTSGSRAVVAVESGNGNGKTAQHSPAARHGTLVEENFGPLPTTYHRDSLFLTARDPRWLFSYWDIDGERVPASEMRDGRRAYFLRVLRPSGEVETLVEVNPGARNWYIPVREGGTTYVAELGYFNRGSLWQCIVRSGEASTPADAVAPEGHEAFATVPQSLTFERLQELVQEHMQEGETLLQAIARITGEGRIQLHRGSAPSWTDEQKRLLAMLLGESLINVIGLGSEEIDRLLRRALQEKLHSESASGLSAGLGALLAPTTSSLFSPLGASWSAQPFSVPRERGFFMHLNAEVIFYGGTQPDASVTVNGEPVVLQPDGSFRFHFTLPDGDFEIPVVAVSADGFEERSATLSFRRQTRRVGSVGATTQPKHLEPLMGRRLA